MTLLIAVLAMAAASTVVYCALTLALRPRSQHLQRALAPYSVGGRVDAGGGSAVTAAQELVRSPVVQRAIAALAEAASRRGILQILKSLLDQADLPVRPAEALFVYVVAALTGSALALLVGNVVWALVALGVLGVVPWMALRAVARRRTRTFTAQLPDMLQLLGTTLRSGFSILQGLETVSRQLTDPIGKEMRHVVVEARLGRPLVDALGEVALRVRSPDFEWVVSAIGIQREVGGNLAELLDIVAETMTARARLRREARTLTAEGRIGAIVLAVLPAAIGGFVYTVNPGYIRPLFHSGTGEILFYGSIGLAVVGIAWLRKIVDIEV